MTVLGGGGDNSSSEHSDGSFELQLQNLFDPVNEDGEKKKAKKRRKKALKKSKKKKKASTSTKNPNAGAPNNNASTAPSSNSGALDPGRKQRYCYLCQEQYDSLGTYILHMHSEHRVEGRYPCHYCEDNMGTPGSISRFKEPCELWNHLEYAHPMIYFNL